MIKILMPTKVELDRIKKDTGLPSYNQVITNLVQHQNAVDEVKREMLECLEKESPRIFTTQLFQFLFELAKQVPKPIHEITLNDLLAAMEKKPA